jgi:hypothetical protein
MKLLASVSGMHIQLALLALLTLIQVANSKTIEIDEYTSVTGRLSLGKDGFAHITSGDIVKFNAAKIPVTNIPIDSSRSRHLADFKHLAVEGKTATVHGTFNHLHGRGVDIFGSEIKFTLLE